MEKKWLGPIQSLTKMFRTEFLTSLFTKIAMLITLLVRLSYMELCDSFLINNIILVP